MAVVLLQFTYQSGWTLDIHINLQKKVKCWGASTKKHFLESTSTHLRLRPTSNHLISRNHNVRSPKNRSAFSKTCFMRIFHRGTGFGALKPTNQRTYRRIHEACMITWTDSGSTMKNTWYKCEIHDRTWYCYILISLLQLQSWSDPNKGS